MRSRGSNRNDDSDGDGVGDNTDEFPSADESIDSDGDGVVTPPTCPSNGDQTIDSDGDGYGDNSDGVDGDAYPQDAYSGPIQTEMDGDNPSGTTPDGCPTVNGFQQKTHGCPDGD